MSEERRGAERVQILGTLPGELMVSQPMAVRDISIRGATIETTYPLHLGSIHELRLTLGELSVVLKGRVVHSRIADVDQELVVYRTGLEFVEISERVATALTDYVADLKAHRAPA